MSMCICICVFKRNETYASMIKCIRINNKQTIQQRNAFAIVRSCNERTLSATVFRSEAIALVAAQFFYLHTERVEFIVFLKRKVF